jgi:hypothetical protein
MKQTCEECGEEFTISPHGNQPVCNDCIDKYCQCNNCSNWFKDNDTPYCDECLPEFSLCGNCDTWHLFEELNHIECERKYVCDSCLKMNYFVCADCGEIYPDHESTETAHNNMICNSCYSSSYFCCEECDAIYHVDDYGGDGYCNSCYRENPQLHEYSYKPTPIFHGLHNPYYGIELETDLYNDVCSAAENLTGIDYTESDFYLKEDGSLSDDGIEIVFHPRNFKSWQEFDFQKILTTVKDYGGKSFLAYSCGLHIHRSNRDLSTVTKIKLILFFGFCSEQIIKLSQRHSPDFAKFNLFKDMPSKDICYKSMKKGDHAKERFQAINFENRDTIEFRVFKGTLKLSTIMAYLAFSHYVVEFCKETLLHEFIDGSSLWSKFIENLKSQKGEAATNLCDYLKNKDLI